LIDCLPNADATACVRCGWVKPARIKGWPGCNCPIPATPEEVARRKAICMACSDWLGDGCRLAEPEILRAAETQKKQESGHCLRGCHNGKRKW
jgi:hypothetical protein